MRLSRKNRRRMRLYNRFITTGTDGGEEVSYEDADYEFHGHIQPYELHRTAVTRLNYGIDVSYLYRIFVGKDVILPELGRIETGGRFYGIKSIVRWNGYTQVLAEEVRDGT